jgi:hypothetical protein
MPYDVTDKGNIEVAAAALYNARKVRTFMVAGAVLRVWVREEDIEDLVYGKRWKSCESRS